MLGPWVPAAGRSRCRRDQDPAARERHHPPARPGGIRDGRLLSRLQPLQAPIVLDLKQESGRKALFKLAETADVLMHNYRPARRSGWAWSTRIREAQSAPVYVAAYGYRAAGPMGRRRLTTSSRRVGLARCRAWSPASRAACQHRGRQDQLQRRCVGLARGSYAREKTGKGQAVECRCTRPWFLRMVEHLYGETSCRGSTRRATSAYSTGAAPYVEGRYFACALHRRPLEGVLHLVGRTTSRRSALPGPGQPAEERRADMDARRPLRRAPTPSGWSS